MKRKLYRFQEDTTDIHSAFTVMNTELSLTLLPAVSRSITGCFHKEI